MSEESKVQGQIIRYARHHGLLVKRNYQAPGAEVGWPDLEIFGPFGKTLFMEMKAPGKKASKIQRYRMIRLIDLGFSVYTCDNFDFGKVIIDELFSL